MIHEIRHLYTSLDVVVCSASNSALLYIDGIVLKLFIKIQ